MKTFLFIIFLLSGYLCLATPLLEKGQIVRVVNIDSVYQKQIVEMSEKIQVIEYKLDSIGAVNRDLLFSRELYSDLISTQLYWFGFFLAVVTLLFGWINFRSVFIKLKEYKKEQDEYKASTSQMIETQSTTLKDEFSRLISIQKTEFKETMGKQAKIIIRVKVDVFRGLYFEANRRKVYDSALCWAVSVLRGMLEHGAKKTSLETWIRMSEEKVVLVTSSFKTEYYKEINEGLNEILDSIDDEYKERIKLLQENINIKYYSLLEKAKTE